MSRSDRGPRRQVCTECSSSSLANRHGLAQRLTDVVVENELAPWAEQVRSSLAPPSRCARMVLRQDVDSGHCLDRITYGAFKATEYPITEDSENRPRPR